jgi:translation initiation factor 1
LSRGKKLDLFVGAHIGDDWSEIEEGSDKQIDKILSPAEHMLVFKREKRRGKTLTLVGPFHLKKDDADTLLAFLKKKLGSGGSYKKPWIELQGECAEKLRVILKDKGFKFKR